MPKRPNGLAARLRSCPNGTFWRRKKSKDGAKVPDYNGILVWYIQKEEHDFPATGELGMLLDKACPKLPTFQRSVAHEAVRRREGGKVARR